MIQHADLLKIFALGAQLDAWAAKVSRHLGQQIPEYQSALEANRKDELVHARILTDLGPLFAPHADPYAVTIGNSAMSDDPRWNAALLNVVERRSEIQFKLAWRLCRSGDLLQIAADEARHVALGREILRHLVLTPDTLVKVRDFLNEVDGVSGSVDVEGLRGLNERVFQETVDHLFC